MNDRWYVRALGGTATVLLASLVACGQDGPDLPEPVAPPPTEPAPALQLTAEEQQAADDVQTIIDEFLTHYNDVMTTDEFVTDDMISPLNLRAAAPMLLQLDEVYANRINNHRVDGQLGWEFVEVADVDMERVGERGGEQVVMPEILLSYCVDATEWTLVDKETGELAEPHDDRLIERPGSRGLVTVLALYFDEWPDLPETTQQWYLTEWTDEEEPC